MPDIRDIVVEGVGSATGTPDRCALSLSLQVAAPTSAAALESVTQLAVKTMEVVGAHGIDASQVRTSDISLQDFHDNDKKRVTARIASYGLSVSVAGLDKAGPLLSELAVVAGDSLHMRELRLEISDPKPLVDAARRAAVTDALDRARQLADAAGVRLGDIVSIDEGPGLQGDPRRRTMSRTSSAAAMPVEGGTSSVTVRVTMRIAMAD